MKLRTLGIIAILAFILLDWWWMREAMTPETPVTPHRVARQAPKPAAAAVSMGKPVTYDAATLSSETPAPASPELEASSAPVVAAIRAAPIAQADSSQAPVRTPDAVLTVPLDQAEHHVVKIGMETYEVSITRFRRILVGPEKREVEYVDMHIWQYSGPAHLETMGEPLNAFSPEDQDYIRKWAQQQAAAADAQNAAAAQ